jgi:phosphatidylserine/phosphatidylglycerophosphate/cardiolipin synthase-like enzyme
MRKSKTNNGLKVNAIAGTYVVMLGINLPKAKCTGLLGFSIFRKDHETGEARYLEGMKAFEETDPGFPPGALYPTNKHPIQIFQWADYAAKPGKTYTYTVAALKGTSTNLKEFVSTSVEITTECPDTGDHDVYFNRGTAASQEYERRFGDKKPDEVVPKQEAYDWLSRGLYEAICDFVSSTKPKKHSLRIAAYEFKYEPFLQIIKDMIKKGVNIEIIYDARKASPGEENTALVKELKLEKYCTMRTANKSYISHNKFIVKLENGKPVSVLTGGTNFSKGGIFGHSNVAHVVVDKKVAGLYNTYWEALKEDDTNKVFQPIVESISPVPATPPAKGTSVVFSPRKNLDALNYYADLAASAKDGLFMTFAFGMADVFKKVYGGRSSARFKLALMEKKTRSYRKEDEAKKRAEEAEIQRLRNMPENVFAIGNFIRTNKFDGWVQEQLTGFNVNVSYIHNKFMLIDPLSNDPIVIAGSANFSEASTTNNDENMLVIRGNTRVADIYLGEFMRLFSHYSFRESLQWRTAGEPPKPLRTDDWWKESFGDKPNSAKRLFFAQVNE